MNHRSMGGPIYFGPGAQSGGGPTHFVPSAQSGGGLEYFGTSAQSGGGPTHFVPSAQSGGGPCLPPPWSSNPLGLPIHAPQFRNSGPFQIPVCCGAVLSGMYSNEEDISINIEEEMRLRKELEETSSKKSDEKDAANPRSPKKWTLGNSLKEMLDKLDHSSSSDFSIYRVPELIRKLNEDAYHPRVVSIGPFHNGDKKCKPMEVFKKRFLKKIVERNRTVGLEEYVEYLKIQEAKVRQCYSGKIEMVDSDEFVTMLLLDGCFIIELLLFTSDKIPRCSDLSTLYTRRLLEDIHHDFRLLENQIPFFVLEGIYNLATTSTSVEEKVNLLELAIEFHTKRNAQEIEADRIIHPIKHFVDLILIFHRPVSPKLRIKGKEYEKPWTATELDDAGVKFKKSSSKCLLDIVFKNGVLEIPHIILDDNTEPIIRNLIALEFCHYKDDTYITDYFIFMDYLINTPKDVDLLAQCGIIENWLGDSKEATSFFNRMTKYIAYSPDNFYFSSVSGELNAYCKRTWPKWRATLVRDYFSSPWRVVSIIAACVLFGLAATQTAYTVKT